MLLTVGRLDRRERYKGHDRIIELLGDLAQDGLNPRYVIAGDGEDRGRLEALATRLGVGGRVGFLGRTPSADLPALYHAADLFVLASTGEGFGIVLLEALALAAGGAPDPLADGELGRLAPKAALQPVLEQACRDRLADQMPSGEVLSGEVRRRFGRAAFDRRVQLCLEQLEAA
jgi:phosphatidylinositol alpha-1,6-mannosyltransferase